MSEKIPAIIAYFEFYSQNGDLLKVGHEVRIAGAIRTFDAPGSYEAAHAWAIKASDGYYTTGALPEE